MTQVSTENVKDIVKKIKETLTKTIFEENN